MKPSVFFSIITFAITGLSAAIPVNTGIDNIDSKRGIDQASTTNQNTIFNKRTQNLSGDTNQHRSAVPTLSKVSARTPRYPLNPDLSKVFLKVPQPSTLHSAETVLTPLNSHPQPQPRSPRRSHKGQSPRPAVQPQQKPPAPKHTGLRQDFRQVLTGAKDTVVNGMKDMVRNRVNNFLKGN